MGDLNLLMSFLDASRLIHLSFDGVMKAAEIDLAFNEYRLLLAISESTAMAHGELLERFHLKKGALSTMLGGSASKGYIEQSLSPADRRVKLVRLTTAGQALLARASELLDRNGFDDDSTFDMKAPLARFRDSLLAFAS